MNTVKNLAYWRGPPSADEAVMVELAYRRLRNDGLQDARRDDVD